MIRSSLLEAVSLQAIDKDVYRLCLGGYVGSEIRELLDISDEALSASLDRLAEHLAPAPPTVSVTAIPFSEW